MAQNNSRSLRKEVDEGMTDGTYKKMHTRERGGLVEGSTDRARAGMKSDNPLTDWYGMVEDPLKVLPDGRVSRV